MPYFSIDDFRVGLDHRRLATVSVPGSARVLNNCHVTAGGDIEKRKAFVEQVGVDLSTTKGLAADGESSYVFGTAGTAPAGTVLYVKGQPASTTQPNYVQLDLSGVALDRIVDWEVYDGKLFVVAEDVNGLETGFYDTDKITTFINDTPPLFARTFRERMYGVRAKNLYFSAIDDLTDWVPPPPTTDPTGAGFINMNAQDSNSRWARGIEVYYGRLAVFFEHAIQFWEIDADPEQFQQGQILRNTGTLSSRTPIQYAGGDVLYLAASGVRSLRSRNSSNMAGVTDVGSPIDKILRAVYTASRNSFVRAFSLIEPKDDRYWLVIDDTIYVLSFFSSEGIAAWSTYTPNFTPSDGAIVGDDLMLRTDTKLYKFGGDGGGDYDTSQVEIVTPFLDAQDPAMVKVLEAIDMAATGEWTVERSLTPKTPDAYELVGTYDGVTFNDLRMGMTGAGTHVSFRLRNSASGAATMAQFVFHYGDATAS